MFPGPSSLDPCHCNMYPILSYSFVPEDQQKQDISPVIYSTDSDVFPASSSSTPVYSDSDISTLETTMDYIQLWPKIYDPNSNIKYVVRSWPYTDQDDGNSSEVYQPPSPLLSDPGQGFCTEAWPISYKAHIMGLCSVYEIQTSNLSECEGSYSYAGSTHC